MSQLLFPFASAASAQKVQTSSRLKKLRPLDPVQILFPQVTESNLERAILTGQSAFGHEEHADIERELTASLWPQTQNPSTQNAYETVLKEQGINDAVYFLPEIHGKPVGLTGVYSFENQPQDVWLGWMGVAPDFRSRGIGRLLVEHAYAHAKESGAERLRIWTTEAPEFEGACALYESLNYRREIYDPNANDGGSKIIVFSKETKPSLYKAWADAAYPIDCESHDVPRRTEEMRKGELPASEEKKAFLNAGQIVCSRFRETLLKRNPSLVLPHPRPSVLAL